MTFLTNFIEGIGSAAFVVVAFLFVLSVVVFVHELGHFLAARWCGVTVRTFSIGFGREIWGFNDRHGTRWRVAWIPLGGYVKFMDDENAASVPSREALQRMSPRERAGAFQAKPLWQRAVVVAAGPIANFILAIAIFSILFMTVGIRSTPARVDEVLAGKPADRAGFRPGDVIVEVQGRTIASFNDVVRIVSASPGLPLEFVVDRGGVPVRLTATPEVSEESDKLGGTIRRGVIGVKPLATPQTIEHRRAGPVEAVWFGVKETHFIIASTLGYIADAVTGRQKGDQLGGPLRIAHISGQVAKAGIEPLFNLIAVISVSIGLINLFPIPLLDGGHLLFYAIEAIRGRPLSERTQDVAFRMGLAVVMLLMAFAFYNDRGIPALWLKGIG